MKSVFVVLFLFVVFAAILSALKVKGANGTSAKAFNFARRAPFMRQDEYSSTIA
ncbi:hypothetical protein PO002_24240 [Cupriavidus necator]|uniref:hypothetical protein n=1 Tax=Cupriavidus necator TaxID=106590 RepID=UPI0039C21618